MRIRSRAPLRLGLAGGGTDVAPYSDIFGGIVLNATICLYAHATLEPLAEPVVEFVAADIGESRSFPAAFPLPTDAGLGLHCAVYNRVVQAFHGGRPIPLRLTTYGDAPPGSGLGSSSTLVVAMLKAFQELLNLPLGDYELAHLAYEIERIDMGLSGGKQDQYAATFGGFNFMEFYDNDRVIVNPLRVKNWIVSEFEASTLLYFTGASRESAKIIDDQRAGVQSGSQATLEGLHALKADAVQMKEAILKGDFQAVAAAMRQSWEQKKRTAASITNDRIDATIGEAIAAGASAAKVSGAGGGGFIMLLVDPARRMAVQRVLEAHGGRIVGCRFTKTGTEGWKIL